jgi:pentatricopeptide repeat protein
MKKVIRQSFDILSTTRLFYNKENNLRRILMKSMLLKTGFTLMLVFLCFSYVNGTNLCTEYFIKGEYEKTILECRKLLAQEKGDNPITYLTLAHAYLKTGKYNEAKKVMSLVSKLNISDSDTYKIIAFIYKELEVYNKAKNALKQAIRLNPDDVDTHYNLGLIFLQLNDKDSAVNEYNFLKEHDTGAANKLFNEIYK